jgi:hypothetical protein
MDSYEHLNSWDPVKLFERRSALIGAAPNGDFKQLSDEALQELVAIARVLRKKTSPAARVSGGKKAITPTLDVL